MGAKAYGACCSDELDDDGWQAYGLRLFRGTCAYLSFLFTAACFARVIWTSERSFSGGANLGCAVKEQGEASVLHDPIIQEGGGAACFPRLDGAHPRLAHAADFSAPPSANIADLSCASVV